MENQSNELPRLTFEDVLRNQLALREWIWKLSKENRCVKDGERLEFARTYYRSTLGLGGSIYLGGGLPGPAQRTLSDIVMNSLCGGDYKKIRVGWSHSSKQTDVSIAKIWREVLTKLEESVFDAALQQAVQLSPEKPGGKVFGGLTGTEKS